MAVTEMTGYRTQDVGEQDIYGLLSFISFPRICRLHLDGEGSLEKQLRKDALAVSIQSEQSEYQMLEQRLRNVIVGFKRLQPYNRDVINECLDRMYSALDYVSLLEQISEQPDSLKIKGLKKAIMKIALERRGHFQYNPFQHYNPRSDEEKRLFSEVKLELNQLNLN